MPSMTPMLPALSFTAPCGGCIFTARRFVISLPHSGSVTNGCIRLWRLLAVLAAGAVGAIRAPTWRARSAGGRNPKYAS